MFLKFFFFLTKSWKKSQNLYIYITKKKEKNENFLNFLRKLDTTDD